MVAYMLARFSKNTPEGTEEGEGEGPEGESDKNDSDTKTNGGIPIPEYVQSPTGEKIPMEIRVPNSEETEIITEKSEHRCERL